MFESWSGLGAVLQVLAHTEDFNGNPKTQFAPGETIRFVVDDAEPNTGILVGWSRDGKISQDLGWEGVSTDSNGRAEWTRTAGPSGSFPVGSYVLKIIVPVNGVSPDPQIDLRFTVGQSTSSTTTTTNTSSTSGSTSGGGGRVPNNSGREEQTPRCAPGLEWNDFVQACLSQQQANPLFCPPGTKLVGNECVTTEKTYMTNSQGQVEIPRDTAERYQNTQQCPPGQYWNDLLGCQVIRTTNAGQGGGSGSGSGAGSGGSSAGGTGQAAAGSASSSSLPSWLEGEWFGLPKLLILGVLAVFLIKGR